MMGEECLNALSLVCIHRDILLDYDKIIDICIQISKEETVETFKAKKTYKVYINFHIFSLYFIVVICKNFRFASTN